MRQIFAASDLRESDLAALYAYPDGSWLRANMVCSADGAAHLAGVTSGLSSEADRRLFALLRTLADVIVVGAGTVRTEKYKPVRQHELWPDLRSGRTPTPPIAVVTARLDLGPSSPVIDLAPPSARTIVITTAQAPADRRAALQERADVIVAGQDAVDLKAAVSALADRGHRRMLAEGGPHLLAQIAAAGLLDELCLTIGPLLAGPGPDRIMAGDTFASAQPLTLAHVLADNGFLFCRYTRKDLLFRTGRGTRSGSRREPPSRTRRRVSRDAQSGAWTREAAMGLRPQRRNLVVWSQSAGPAARRSDQRIRRPSRARRCFRAGMHLALLALLALARAVRPRWKPLLPGAVLIVTAIIMHGSVVASVTLLPGLLLVMSAPLLPGAPGAEHTELKRELAGYRTNAQRNDLEATLDRYPDDVTREIREILSGQAAEAANIRWPAMGRY
jgi:riboflavin biosynthesis pyrimidine reductase